MVTAAIVSRRCSYDYFAYHSDAPTATLTTYQVMAVKMMPLLSAAERSEVEALTNGFEGSVQSLEQGCRTNEVPVLAYH